MLAARGARKLDEKEESVEDKTAVLHVRRQARRVHILALAAAAAVTALCFAIPL
ncbi:MAG: hypothetical protein ACE5IP_12645 [Terriglobia bacterium]